MNLRDGREGVDWMHPLIVDEVMEPPMLAAGDDRQIVNCVVPGVKIDVVNVLFSRERATKVHGCGQTMGIDVSVGVGHRMIAADIRQHPSLSFDLTSPPVVALRAKLGIAHLESLLGRLGLSAMRGTDLLARLLREFAALHCVTPDKSHRSALHVTVLRVIAGSDRRIASTAAFTKAGV